MSEWMRGARVMVTCGPKTGQTGRLMCPEPFDGFVTVTLDGDTSYVMMTVESMTLLDDTDMRVIAASATDPGAQDT